MSNNLTSLSMTRLADKAVVGPAIKQFFGRPFSIRQKNKVLVLYEKNSISFSQVYTFLVYAEDFRKRFDAQFRFVASDDFMKGAAKHLEGASQVLVQTWIFDPPEKVAKIVERLRALPNNPRLVYLDSMANSDLRIANQLTDFDLYYKKTIFTDHSEYFRKTYGHTTLSDYYGKYYNTPLDDTDWQVPKEMIPRLRVSPSFVTSPGLLDRFRKACPDFSAEHRDIDVHGRIGGTDKESWYGDLRRDGARLIDDLQGLSVTKGFGIPFNEFMAELERSKLCFSPFGYGEHCWRDIEAVCCGSVVLKQDASHLRTDPDLYVPYETYVPLRWDMQDFEEKVRELLANDALREKIARQAFEKAQNYILNAGPVEAYKDIFAET